MEKKGLIIFDIDGTLTDTVKIHQKAFVEVLTEMGLENLNPTFNTFKHHTDSFVAKEIYESASGELFTAEKMSQFEKGLTEKIERLNVNEIAGAKKLIERLEKETDFAVCYATGSLKRPAEYKLNSIGIHFDQKQLATSDHIFERENIVGAAIENACEYYDVDGFERFIAVGDGIWDLKAAQNLGLEFIGVGLLHEKELIEKGAKIVYENLLDFKV